MGDKIRVFNNLSSKPTRYEWRNTEGHDMIPTPIDDYAWREICYQIAMAFSPVEKDRYVAELFNISCYPHSEIFCSWEEQGKAICRVKGLNYE